MYVVTFRNMVTDEEIDYRSFVWPAIEKGDFKQGEIFSSQELILKISETIQKDSKKRGYEFVPLATLKVEKPNFTEIKNGHFYQVVEEKAW